MGFGAWDTALQHVVEALGARSGLLIPPGIERGRLFEMQQESAAHPAFSEIWHRNLSAPEDDPHWARPARMGGRSGVVVIEDDITTPEERETLPYFRAVAGPGDRMHWAMIRLRTRAGRWCMPLYRGRAEGPFGEREAVGLLAVAPAITRMVAQGERLAQARLRARIEGIDDLGRMAFAVGPGGVVLFANAAAERGEGRDIWLAGGRLRAAEAGNAARLPRFLAEAAARDGDCDPVVLHREGVPWMVADALPLTRATVSVFSGARAVVMLTPVAAVAVPEVGVLRAAFGLTPAEARLAQHLARGMDLGEAASALGIGRETVRTHLEALFDKTGCRRQAALVALLTRLGVAAAR